MSPGQETLLGAMIAVIAVVWSIGFLAYTFIWNYFYAWASKVPRVRWSPLRLRWRYLRHIVAFGLRWRFFKNLVAFLGYGVAGGLAFFSIIASAVALSDGSPSSFVVAWWLFVAALEAHLLLFTYEIYTSVRHVWRRLR